MAQERIGEQVHCLESGQDQSPSHSVRILSYFSQEQAEFKRLFPTVHADMFTELSDFRSISVNTLNQALSRLSHKNHSWTNFGQFDEIVAQSQALS